MTVFIRRAPEDDNTVLECIRTIAAIYDCKILQLYKYDANVEDFLGYLFPNIKTFKETKYMKAKCACAVLNYTAV